MNKHTVALVGCGRIYRKHLDAIEQLSNRYQLIALCDIDLEKKSQFEIDVPMYSSMGELFCACRPDIVSICTPSGIHPRQSIFAAENGSHVITEKPMATRWKDGLEMIEAFDSLNKQLFVVKQNRLNPTIQKLKRAVDEGWLGKINTIQANVFWTRPQSYYDQDDWRGTWEFDGGALMNQASHYVDLLDWLGGPVECVQAMMSTQARAIEVEDTAVLNLKWRRGALGSMTVSMLSYPKNLEGSLTILGESGSATVGGIALNKITRWEFEHPDAGTLSDVITQDYETDSVYGNGHLAYYKNVADVLDGKAKAISNGREGLRSLELLIACYRASQTQRSIYLPLDM